MCIILHAVLLRDPVLCIEDNIFESPGRKYYVHIFAGTKHALKSHYFVRNEAHWITYRI